ncbi:MAG: hypothetical protein HY286_04675 [Planctomycetes bacterium]|nr:hypothetical protein [Planctomycetota bacterium]
MKSTPKLLLVALALSAPAAFAQTGNYVNFESPQVNPIAISPDGTLLLAVNTADARLSIFSLAQPSSPGLISEIPVGVEPVSVRARTNDEVWVVNHTSDSVSIVSISQGIVIDTIYCKDEPCDVIFAGSPQRAYVTAARSNAVKVFDVTTHAFITSIGVFGENPRALAASADGSHIYATFAQSGNRTTIIPATLAPPQSPPTNPNLPAPPQVGLIVDATDPLWVSFIKFTMPDNDVVEIATATNTVSRYFPRVGTHNTGIAVHPVTGDLYISNTDARNLVHFEPNVKGHMVDNRVAKIDIISGAVSNFDLNPGTDYTLFPNNTALSNAIAQPMGAVFDSTGSNLYVASLGTDRVARLDANGNILARIELNTSATGTGVDPRHKRGPRGLAYSAANGRLYVQNRISNSISIIHTQNDTLVNEIPVGGYDPTPDTIKNGRGFLYDAKLSGNGTQSCATCHYDADIDLLAWDLGNPGGDMQTVQSTVPVLGSFTFNMHPMKGPMTTQTLKGFNNSGQVPLHWRGDRADFLAFAPAFASLMGGTQLSAADMTAYRDFVNTIAMEPNPNQNLDRTLPAALPGFVGNPQTGQSTFNTNQYQPFLTCNTCHTSTTGGQASFIIPASALQESQDFNVPQLRNAYQKMGFNNAVGAQSRGGFGFIHDGIDTNLFTFLTKPVFGNVQNDATKKNNLQVFLLCFDTGTAPGVGYSRTVTSVNATSAGVATDVTLLQGQASAGNVDVIIKGRVDGQLRGFLYQTAQNNYKSDKTGVGPYTWAQLQAKALAGSTFTIMGVPVGSGQRMGIDRNMNGVLDGDEPPPAPLQNYGSGSPPCATPMAISTNSMPSIGNDFFAFTCTNSAPSSLALTLVCSNSLPAGMPFFGFDLLVDLASPEVYPLDMYADPSGFGVAPVAIPNNPILAGNQYSAQAISLNFCAPQGLAASNGMTMTLTMP